MSTIYIDTSIIIDENFLRSATAHAFFKACALLDFSIVIPEVVVDETKGNYPKKLKERISIYQKARRDLAKLVDLDPVDLVADHQIAQFNTWLESFLTQHKVEIAPYPNISTKELVEQSYVGDKPFKPSGEGHKDYLVWNTIREHIDAQKTSPPNFLLTNNTKDFCAENPDGSKTLHPQLGSQVVDPSKRPAFYSTLKALFDDHLAPHLPGVSLDDLKYLGKPDIEQQVQSVLENELPSYHAFRLGGLPFNDDVTVSSVGASRIENISMLTVDDEIVIDVSGTVEIEVDGFIGKSDYYQVAEDSSYTIHINDGDWNDHVMWASITIDAPFEATLIYSIAKKEFSGSSIQLSDEISDHDYH